MDNDGMAYRLKHRLGGLFFGKHRDPEGCKRVARRWDREIRAMIKQPPPSDEKKR